MQGGETAVNACPGPAPGSGSIDELVRVLLEVARDMSSERSLPRLLEFIPRAVAGLVDAERCTIFLVDAERGELYSRVATGLEGELRLKVGEGIAGQVARTGKALHIPSAYEDPRFSSSGDAVTGFVTRDLLCVPMRHRDGTVLGVFQVLNKRGGSFSDRDEELLELFGSHAAVALEGARLDREKDEAIARLTEARLRLEALNSIQKEILLADDLDSGLASAVRHVAEMFGAEAGSILLLSKDEQRLHFGHSFGGRAEELRAADIASSEGVAGWVVVHRQGALTNDARSDPRFDRAFTERLGYEVENLMAAPMLSDGRVAGVLEVLNRRGRSFEPHDLKALEIMAGQIWSTLERHVLLEETHRSQRLATVGNTASKIVHDLKNPLTVLRGILQMCEEEELPAAQRIKYAAIGIREIDRSIEMMQEILDYGRGESALALEPTKLLPLAQRAIAILERDCRQKELRVEIDVDPALAVEANPSKLERVIFNLARNAVEALARGGTLRLSARAADGVAELRVSDDGPGIPPAVLPRLFEAFATHGKSHGTGLGLAICKSLIEAHRGSIFLDTAHRPGTCFVIRLPGPQGHGKVRHSREGGNPGASKPGVAPGPPPSRG